MLPTLTRSAVVDVGVLACAAVGAVQPARAGVGATVEATDRSSAQLADTARTTDAAGTTSAT